MTAYYNENDPGAAQWLKNLIAAKLIAAGDVDTRSIVDVKADDLKGYTQCHFFAGIGGWSHALRLAGWPDDRPVWTGSCPCQPFSVAGRQAGTADERHLWPIWFNLIRECKPATVFGEQVEAAIRHGWLDLVQADLEGIGYAFGAAGLPAAGFGAPHIRQRLWFVADANGGNAGAEREQRSGQQRFESQDGGAGELADATDAGHERRRPGEESDGGDASRIEPERLRDAGGALAHAGGEGSSEQRGQRDEPEGLAAASFWSDCDWLPCRDGKARPVEPGTFPLAHGVPGRVVKLRAYGNAIVPQVAAAFIRASCGGLA